MLMEVTDSAEFTGKDENASLQQHAGVEMQQVPHIYCHNQLRQVPLINTSDKVKRRFQMWPSLCTSAILTFSGMEGRLLGSGAMKYGIWSKQRAFIDVKTGGYGFSDTSFHSKIWYY